MKIKNRWPIEDEKGVLAVYVPRFWPISAMLESGKRAGLTCMQSCADSCASTLLAILVRSCLQTCISYNVICTVSRVATQLSWDWNGGTAEDERKRRAFDLGSRIPPPVVPILHRIYFRRSTRGRVSGRFRWCHSGKPIWWIVSYRKHSASYRTQ